MRHFAAAAFLLLASGCSLFRPEPIAPEDPERCGRFDDVSDHLEIDPGPARQGSTLRITRAQWRGPFPKTPPLDCTSDWSVSDPSLATLAEDRASIRIADDARPGATVTISYRINGKTVAASLAVVAKDAFVLTGRRGQRSAEGCDGFVPIGELEFTADGGFSVTFNPFETYKDYWGGYRLDTATGSLSLSVTGGNYRPPSLDLEGRASISDEGRLVLEHMYLGQPGGRPPPDGGTCRYTFG